MNTLFSKNKNILVIGDAILDIYHFSKVDRISPEAPVPVALVLKTEEKLGGAANVSNNIAHLNNETTLVAFAGEDQNAVILKNLLEDNKIEYNLIPTEQPTITKVRIISGVQQIVRVDFETKNEITESIERKQFQYIDNLIEKSDVIILSDYGKGFVSDNLSTYLIDKVNELNKIIIIDPKGKNWDKYRNATVITPNIKELSDIIGYSVKNEDTVIEKVGKEIQKKYNLKNLLVTRSEKGMSFFDSDSVNHVRTTATEVFDVSGAGDTVVATLATAISSGYNWLEAVKLANKAAGVVVSKIGTVPITYQELENTLLDLKENKKNISQYELEKLSNKLQNENKKIVFTNGCFDIIHKGHIKYLQQAKKLGDILIIGLNSDSSVKRLKGAERPIKEEDERALILSSMEFIDYVVTFEEDTPYETIKKIKPDILVKGGDYDIENIVGREFAKETKTIPFVDGYSTTSTINKMKQ
jgi:D-beta-D-heptose 7-phosphate kinase/D-beta-D-heptose 1-phosphate adenosyltransferase